MPIGFSGRGTCSSRSTSSIASCSVGTPRVPRAGASAARRSPRRRAAGSNRRERPHPGRWSTNSELGDGARRRSRRARRSRERIREAMHPSATRVRTSAVDAGADIRDDVGVGARVRPTTRRWPRRSSAGDEPARWPSSTAATAALLRARPPRPRRPGARRRSRAGGVPADSGAQPERFDADRGSMRSFLLRAGARAVGRPAARRGGASRAARSATRSAARRSTTISSARSLDLTEAEAVRRALATLADGERAGDRARVLRRAHLQGGRGSPRAARRHREEPDPLGTAAPARRAHRRWE